MFKSGDIVKTESDEGILFVTVITDNIYVPEGHSRILHFCGVVLKSTHKDFIVGETYISLDSSKFQISNSSEVSNYIP